MQLLKTENNGHYGYDSDDTTKYLFNMEKIKNANKRKLEAHYLERSAYICCDFIGAYDEIIELLWRKAYEMKKNRRKVMPPLMLEVIIYIKKNSRLWNKMYLVLVYSTAR